MRPALVLHAGPHPVALEQERHLVVAAHVGRVGGQHLLLPAHAVGVAGVHVEQVLGEEVGLLAPLGPPDLDDHVLVVVGVLGQQQQPQLRLQPGQGGLGLLGLVPHAQLPGHLQVAAGPLVAAVALDDGGQLLVAPRLGPQRLLVGDHGGVAQPRLDRVELLLEVGQAFQHTGEVRRGRPPPRR
jgi:hypothetical protein